MNPKRKAVVAIVLHEGKVLMGKKKSGGNSVVSGKWHVPGETLEPGETDEQGLIRGMMEEAGIEVKPGKHLGSHQIPGDVTTNWYECKPLTSNITAGSDLEEAAWIPLEKVLIICQKRLTSLWPQKALEYFHKK